MGNGYRSPFVDTSMSSLLLGCILGAAVVGSSVQRTIAVERGQVNVAVFSSIINSASYGFSIYSVANNDWIAYTGTAIGSTVLMAYMAWRNRV